MNLQSDKQLVEEIMNQMQIEKTGFVTYEEFLTFYYLVPAEAIKSHFKHWVKASIDIGESVVVNDEEIPGTSAWVTLVAGGVAGAVSRTATAPFDRLKVIL